MHFEENGQAGLGAPELCRALARTRSRPAGVVRLYRQLFDYTPVLMRNHLYSNYVYKKDTFWYHRWHLVKGSASAQRVFELVYTTDHSGINNDDPRRVGVVRQDLTIVPRRDRKERGVQFELRWDDADEAPIQMSVADEAELDTWTKLLTHAKMSAYEGIDAVKKIAQGDPVELSRFLPAILRLLFRALCHARRRQAQLDIFETILRLFSAIEYSRVQNNKAASAPAAPEPKEKRGNLFERSFSKLRAAANSTPEAPSDDKPREAPRLLNQYARYMFRDYAIEAWSREALGDAPMWTYEALCAAWGAAANAEGPADAETKTVPDDRNIPDGLELKRGVRAGRATGVSGVSDAKRRQHIMHTAGRFSDLLLEIVFKSLVFHAEKAKGRSWEPDAQTDSADEDAQRKSKGPTTTEGDATAKSGTAPSKTQSNASFSSETFLGQLPRLVESLAKWSLRAAHTPPARTLTTSLGVFFRDAFDLLDRTYVTRLLAVYIKSLDAEAATSTQSRNAAKYQDNVRHGVEFKCEILNIISGHQDYAGLMAPLQFRGDLAQSLERAAVTKAHSEQKSADLLQRFQGGDSKSKALKPDKEAETEDETAQPATQPIEADETAETAKTDSSPDVAAEPSEKSSVQPTRTALRPHLDAGDNAPPSPVTRAGLYLASAATDSGHYIPRVIAKELQGALNRRVMYPELSLENLSTIGKLLRVLLCRHAMRGWHTGDRNQQAIHTQMYLPILPILWSQPALVSLEGKRALKDIYIALVYILRHVPAAWIRTAVENKNSALYIDPSPEIRSEWLASCLDLAQSVLNELKHAPDGPGLLPADDNGGDDDGPLPNAAAAAAAVAAMVRTGVGSAEGRAAMDAKGPRNDRLDSGDGGAPPTPTAPTMPAPTMPESIAGGLNGEGLVQSEDAGPGHGGPVPTPDTRAGAEKDGQNGAEKDAGNGSVVRQAKGTAPGEHETKSADAVAKTDEQKGAEKDAEKDAKKHTKKEGDQAQKSKEKQKSDASNGGISASKTAVISDSLSKTQSIESPTTPLGETTRSSRRPSIQALDLASTAPAPAQVSSRKSDRRRRRREAKSKSKKVRSAMTPSPTRHHARSVSTPADANRARRPRRTRAAAAVQKNQGYQTMPRAATLAANSSAAAAATRSLPGLLRGLSDSAVASNPVLSGGRERGRAARMASRVLYAEVCDCLLDLVTDILIPLADAPLRAPVTADTTIKAKSPHAQAGVLSFLMKILTAHSAVRVRRRACAVVSWLLHRYGNGFYPVAAATLDAASLGGYWYNLLRQATGPDAQLSFSALRVLYQISHVTHVRAGSATPWKVCAIKGFSNVVRKVLRLHTPLHKKKAPSVIERIIATPESAGTPMGVIDTKSLFEQIKKAAEARLRGEAADEEDGGVAARKRQQESLADIARGIMDGAPPARPAANLLAAIKGVVEAAERADPKDSQNGNGGPAYLAASHQVARVFTRMARILEAIAPGASPRTEKLNFDQSPRELTASRYAVAVREYRGCPDVQRFYMAHLRDFHEMNGDFAEAAAASEALAMLEKHTMVSSGGARSKAYTTHARKASELYEKAGFYERAVAAEKLIADFCTEQGDFKQAQALRTFQKLTQLSAKLSRRDDRSLGTYYRVAFFGDLAQCFEGMLPRPSKLTRRKRKAAGKATRPTFVFRERKLTRIMEVCERLKKRFGAMLDAKVTLVKDAEEAKGLPGNTLGMKVSRLEPWKDDFVSSSKYHKQAEVRTFVFETPFTMGGKSHGATSEQYRRRTLVRVAERFPCSQKLQAVENEESTVLTPIECAILIIKTKIKDLTVKAMPLDGSDPKLKTLYQVLSGAVNTQVHGGVTEVAEAFLSAKTVESHPIQHVKILRGTIVHFLEVCKRGLKVSKELLNDEVAAASALAKSSRDKTKQAYDPSSEFKFQQVLEDSYGGLEETMQQYLVNASRRIASKVVAL